MSDKKVIKTDKAPAAIGPYSQGIITGNFIFVSGQIPIDPATGNIVSGSIAMQTEQCLKNIKAVLEAAGTTMDNVVKCTVYLKDIKTFKEMNDKYTEYFKTNFPARATIGVAALPKEAGVEIEAIAIKK